MPPRFGSVPAPHRSGAPYAPWGARGAIGALVEVSAETPEALRAELLSAAYRASRCALMVAVCSGVARSAVDAGLTPAVREVGLDVHGILYLDGEDDDALREAARAAAVVVASSERFRARLAEWGIACVDARDAIERLRGWSDGAGAA